MSVRFGKIKRDSIIKVYNTALDQVRTTRTVLSSMTDLSFVTVSKICDELLALNILKQSFTTDKAAVRRSRVLSVKNKYYIGIYTLEPELFTFNICDLSLRILHTFSYIPSDDIFIDDAVKRFFKFASGFEKAKARNCICCGTGILVPGNYDPENDTVSSSPIPHFNSVHIGKLFSDKAFGTIPVIRSIYFAFCKEAQLEIDNDDRVLSLFINKGDLKSAYFTKNSDENTSLSDIGALSVSNTNEKSLNRLCKQSPDPSDLFPRLADIIFTLMNTVKVTRIILNGNLYTRMDAAASVLSKELSLLCNKRSVIPPAISNVNIREKAVKNIAREIRNLWFCEKILEEDIR